MGDIHSTFGNEQNIDIIGNGNSAIIVNGLTFNLSSMVQIVATATIKKYRAELVAIHLASFCLVFLSILMTVQYFMPHQWTQKDTSQEQYVKRFKCNTIENQKTDCVAEKHFVALQTDTVEYQNYFEKLEHALNELNHILLYDTENTHAFKNSMQCIENMCDIAQTSSSMLFFVTMKLIDRNYASLCMIVINKNINDALWCQEAWQTTCSTLHCMYRYMKLSPDICHSAIVAGIIPVLTSYIYNTSRLENLNKTHSVAVMFEIILRIFHTIAQIEELRHHLITNNCCTILLHVIEYTTNKLFRCIIFLTVAQLSEGSTIKIPLTSDDATDLFRLYYKSAVSNSQMAYELKYSELLNGFFAIGRCEYECFNVEE